MNNLLGDPDNTSVTQQYDFTQVYQVLDPSAPP